MWLLVLEALAALALLVFIVAWTMSGRRRVQEPSTDEATPGDGKVRDPEQR
ncbi:MAG: hypothetical protein JNN03_20795 [Rubrivivax sp.]|nr:hypothetical protein [Rubrivivax sp.]